MGVGDSVCLQKENLRQFCAESSTLLVGVDNGRMNGFSFGRREYRFELSSMSFLSGSASRGERTNCVSFSISAAVPAPVENGFLLLVPASAKKTRRRPSVCERSGEGARDAVAHHACVGRERASRAKRLTPTESPPLPGRLLLPSSRRPCHRWHGSRFGKTPRRRPRLRPRSAADDMLCCCHG